MVTGSDILVVRRASTCLAGSTGCDAVDVSKATYFQTGLCASDSGQFVIDTDATKFVLTKPPACGASAPKAGQRSYNTHIYFVAKNNKAGDGIPTLKMLELGAGSFNTVALALGIEQMQIEYGNGVTPVYAAMPALAASSAAAYTDAWRHIVTVKLHLLVRNTTSSTGYTDAKTYTLGQKADGTAYTLTPGGAFRRHVFTTVVRLNNVAGRL